METKKNLRLQLEKANDRIEDLEWIICKGEHNYKPIGEITIAYDPFGKHDLKATVFRCIRCGKKKQCC